MSKPLYSPDLAPRDLFLFPRMKQDLILRHFADVAKVQQESLAALASIFVEDFRQCFQQWEWRWDCFVLWEYFEGG